MILSNLEIRFALISVRIDLCLTFVVHTLYKEGCSRHIRNLYRTCKSMKIWSPDALYGIILRKLYVKNVQISHRLKGLNFYSCCMPFRVLYDLLGQIIHAPWTPSFKYAIERLQKKDLMKKITFINLKIWSIEQQLPTITAK